MPLTRNVMSAQPWLGSRGSCRAKLLLYWRVRVKISTVRLFGAQMLFWYCGVRHVRCDVIEPADRWWSRDTRPRPGHCLGSRLLATSQQRPCYELQTLQWRRGFQLAAKMAVESAETTEKKEACSPVVSAWTASIGEFKAFWRPATVVRCFHPLFDVQFHTGEIGKRHMNQLRTRTYISPSAKAASLRKRQSTAHSSSGNVRPTGSDSGCVVYLKSSVYLTSSVASSCIFNLLSDFGVGECGVRPVRCDVIETADRWWSRDTRPRRVTAGPAGQSVAGHTPC